ncbi:MAG: xanthine dehydrogenase family protein molybdopterin-binding subunit, partial [Mobilitalea sp.]
VDGAEKVTGQAVFADDIKMEDMLYAAVVRSPYHHALIKSIDKTIAEQVKGVVGIYVASDIPGLNRVKIFRPDQPILAETKVRFKGDPVALVVAENLKAAQLASDKIIVNYEGLQPIFNANEAAKETINLIHADSENVTFGQSLIKGDIEEGFANADLIIENTYTTPAHEHAYLEPEAGVAYIDSAGILVINVGTQNAQHNRSELAGVLNIPIDKIRVVQTTTGGGFGGKLDITIQGLLATAAFLTKKPVKLVYSREESFLATTKRHPFHIKHRLGVSNKGFLTAIDVQFLADTGAYLSFGPGVVIRAVVHSTGPYRIPNVKIFGQAVYTNNPPSGAMRGFGVPQIAYAMESQMDIAAKMLGIDPLEIRRINGYRANDYTATGQELENQLAYLDTLSLLKAEYERANEEIAKHGKNDIVKKGVGVASMWFGPGKTGLKEQSEVYLELLPMGKVRLVTTAADIGQGLDTVMAQLVAKALNLPFQMVEVSSKDTFDSPDGGFTCASRQTYNTGNAVLMAVERMKSSLLQCASELLNLPTEELVMENGLVSSALDQKTSVGLAELYTRGIPRAYGNYSASVTPLDKNGQGVGYETYTFGTQMAVVEVNVVTGEVKVNRIVVAHDVGTVINPQSVEGQLEGGVMMGLGMALKEKYITDKTKNFGNYHIPRLSDVPEIKSIHLEVKHEHGPFGAAGAGECSLIPTAPAITNAISNAIGYRFFDLPVTADKIKKALSNTSPEALIECSEV